MYLTKVTSSQHTLFQTDKAIELLIKFESITGPALDLRDKYVSVLHHYGRDLEAVRKLYQKQKNEPIIPRNLPPISGRISWARQLFRKIETPMKVFKKKPDILKVQWNLYVKWSLKAGDLLWQGE